MLPYLKNSQFIPDCLNCKPLAKIPGEIIDDMRNQNYTTHELDDEDRFHITEIFLREISPKLGRLGARMGTLNCEFAGKQYKNWNIQFKSAGSDFNIVDFIYDEDSAGIDLDL